tara:strand:- start:79 stop:252 length:174 start_codon:yes stop_codon:yes gene_type:complete
MKAYKIHYKTQTVLVNTKEALLETIEEIEIIHSEQIRIECVLLSDKKYHSLKEFDGF